VAKSGRQAKLQHWLAKKGNMSAGLSHTREFTELGLISIVVPTYNRPASLALCLEAITRLRYPKDQFEVIVVDDGGAVDIGGIIDPLRQSINIRMLRQENTGPAGARNNGAAHATGQFIAFTDDDCSPTEDWLRALTLRLQQDPSVMYGGHTINALSGNVYSVASQSLIDFLYGYFNSDPAHARFFTSNNMALSRSMFESTGGFDTNFPTASGEDRELCDRWQQLGYKMGFVPEAQVRHRHVLNFRSFWKQHFRYGAGAWRFWKCKRARGFAGPKLEPLSFYLSLMNHARKNTLTPALPLSILLVLSQIANAAGFAWARIKDAWPGSIRSGQAEERA
jgi:GT2 family glycosyltransferase